LVSALAIGPSAGQKAQRDEETKNMPVCKSCGNEADELLTVKVSGRSKKVCEDCADRAREESEVAEASESVVQGMMGFKGRR